MPEISWLLEYHHLDGEIENQYFNTQEMAQWAFDTIGAECKDIYRSVILYEINWPGHTETPISTWNNN